jgi:hypothetical protein
MRSELKAVDKAVKAKSRPGKTAKLIPSPKASEVGATAQKELKSVRQAKLERARRLLEDAHYPSDEVIESVADLMARTWDAEKKMRKGSGG